LDFHVLFLPLSGLTFSVDSRQCFDLGTITDRAITHQAWKTTGIVLKPGVMSVRTRSGSPTSS
jgi:hypothetical protein